MNIDDAVAVVTGGASGLGLATVKALLKRGAAVVILDLPNSEGEAIAEELGDRVRFAPADVTDVDAVTAALDIAESLGALRIVVNSAGIGDFIPMLSESGAYPIENFIRVLNINLVGTFNVLRLAAERIATQERLGRRTWRDRQYRVGGRIRWPNRAGRLFRIQGRRGRYDVAHRPRLGQTADPRSDDCARTLRDADHGAVT